MFYSRYTYIDRYRFIHIQYVHVPRIFYKAIAMYFIKLLKCILDLINSSQLTFHSTSIQWMAYTSIHIVRKFNSAVHMYTVTAQISPFFYSALLVYTRGMCV